MDSHRFTLTITIGGEDHGDLVLALQEVLERVEQGYTSGCNSNDSGNFTFDLKDDG